MTYAQVARFDSKFMRHCSCLPSGSCVLPIVSVAGQSVDLRG